MNYNNMSASVTLISTQSGKEQKYVLSSQDITLIGRSPDCQIVLNPNEFVTVSRYHTQIELIKKNDQFQWQITDKGTTNGTLINGEKINSPYILNMGDRIMLGLKGPEFIFKTESLNATVFVEIDQPKTATTSVEEVPVNKEENIEKAEEKVPVNKEENIEKVEEKIPVNKEENIEKVEEELPVNKGDLGESKKSEKKEKREVKTGSKDDKLSEEKQPITETKTEEITATIKSESPIPEPKKEVEKKITKPTVTVNQQSANQPKNIFNLITIQQTSLIETGLQDLQCVCCSQDNNLIAIGSKDKNIKIWNLETNAEISTLSGHKMAVNSLGFSLDGKTLASGSGDKNIKIWNLETNAEISTLSGHKMAINSLCFNSEGKILASGSADKNIKIWNLETNEEISTLSGHKMAVNSLCFSPDSKTLFSASADKTIKIWNLENNTEEKTLKIEIKTPIQHIALDTENKLICLFFSDKISLFNYENEQEIYSVSIPSEFGSLLASNHSGDMLFSLLNQNAIGIYTLA